MSTPNILWSILNTYYILDSSSSCINCYISPLRLSAYTAAYNAHSTCHRRDKRYLAFLGLPVKSHRPKPSRPMSKVFQYLVLFTVHQPRYIVVSYGSMNMCKLHNPLKYKILWLILRRHTIYSGTERSARFAVSHALTVHATKDRCCALACRVAQLSQSDGPSCTVQLNAPSSQRFSLSCAVCTKTC